MSKLLERPDAADRRHDTLSEHQEVIRQPTDYLPDLESAKWRPVEREQQAQMVCNCRFNRAFSWLRGRKV